MFMKIDEQQHGAVRVIKPHGPLVETDVPALKARVQEVSEASLGRVVLDLSAVPFIDSKGLEALLDMSDAMGDLGQVLKLCAVNSTIAEVLDLTDLSPLFDQFDDATHAVRSYL